MAAAEHASTALQSGGVPHDTGMGEHVGECAVPCLCMHSLVARERGAWVRLACGAAPFLVGWK
jgi:hypothetical protein